MGNCKLQPLVSAGFAGDGQMWMWTWFPRPCVHVKQCSNTKNMGHQNRLIMCLTGPRKTRVLYFPVVLWTAVWLAVSRGERTLASTPALLPNNQFQILTSYCKSISPKFNDWLRVVKWEFSNQIISKLDRKATNLGVGERGWFLEPQRFSWLVLWFQQISPLQISNKTYQKVTEIMWNGVSKQSLLIYVDSPPLKLNSQPGTMN